MGKRFAGILISVLISGVAILGYFLYQGRKTLLTDPYKAVPGDASFIIETRNIREFIDLLNSDKGLFGETVNIKEIEVFRRKINYLADQFEKDNFEKLVNERTALLSFHFLKEEKLQILLAMTLPSEMRLRHIKEIIRNSGIKEIIEKNLTGYNVIELPYKINGSTGSLIVSEVSGLLLCCSSETLFKNAVNQSGKETDIRNLPGFSKVMQASGYDENKLFIVFKNIEEPLKTIFREDVIELAENACSLASSSEAGIYINDDGIILSGYTESTETSERLSSYKDIRPGVSNTYRILPSSTILFETLMFEKSGLGKDNKTATEGYNLALKLNEYLDNEVTRAIIGIRDRPISENTLVIFELKDRQFAEKVFLDEFSKVKGKNGIDYFQPDDQIKIPVFKTPYRGFSSFLFPEFLKNTPDDYFAFYDNYLIAGNSYAAISRLLYDNLLNKTLVNDITYRDFEGTLPSVAGYFFYCVPQGIIDYLENYLNEDIIRTLKANILSVNKITAAGFRLASSNEMLYNSLSVQFRDEARIESTTDWETLLDTTAAIKPFFFTNHITGAREIFIQDMKNSAYLVNSAGRVLWKVPLRERISSQVYMIDYFRNGKYQILFSGKNYLHLLDRNGNYVERYPVRLRSPSTNPMALFDYDNNHNYRILIAGEDKNIYAYDKTGSVVKGWNMFRTNGTVSSEISWFRVSGKDYLIVSDEKSVYFLDRSGKTRLNIKEPVTKASGSAIRNSGGSNSSAVCSSPDGTIQHIYFDGKVTKFSLRGFTSDHTFDFFDVDGDGFGEYIFIDNGILYLYDHNRAEMFHKEFGSDRLGGPITFIFSSTNRMIGVFDINKNLIFLLDRNGNVMKGFPLKGASMFSVGRLVENGGWNLIVGGTDRFLYNYRLETK